MPEHHTAIETLRKLGHLYTRPALDPNGQPWPNTSSYLAGFGQFNMNGASAVTVDNRENNSDVLVKVYYRVGPRPTAIRVLFLKQTTG